MPAVVIILSLALAFGIGGVVNGVLWAVITGIVLFVVGGVAGAVTLTRHP